jgi:hypothetical protein
MQQRTAGKVIEPESGLIAFPFVRLDRRIVSIDNRRVVEK